MSWWKSLDQEKESEEQPVRKGEHISALPPLRDHGSNKLDGCDTRTCATFETLRLDLARIHLRDTRCQHIMPLLLESWGSTTHPPKAGQRLRSSRWTSQIYTTRREIGKDYFGTDLGLLSQDQQRLTQRSRTTSHLKSFGESHERPLRQRHSLQEHR